MTIFEYLVTVKVGLCIDKCSTYLTVPTIEPSIYTYLLDEASVGEEIALPGFWTYSKTQYATIY